MLAEHTLKNGKTSERKVWFLGRKAIARPEEGFMNGSRSHCLLWKTTDMAPVCIVSDVHLIIANRAS